MMSSRLTLAVLVTAVTSSSGTGASSADRHISVVRKNRAPASLQPEQQGLRGPTHLTQRLKDVAWEPSFLAALNTQVDRHVNKGDSGNSAQHAGSGGGEGGDKQKVGPISVQIPEKVINELLLKFSDGCKHRMNEQFEGKGAEMHTFGGPSGNFSTANCNVLDGTICDTHAHVVQKRDTPDNREMFQTIDVTGKGCLPSECMSASDLDALARFMRGQAKDQVPGMGVTVELNVDCTRSGGHSVLIEDESQHPADTGFRGGRSSASTHWPQQSAIAAVLLAVLLRL